MPYKQQFIKLTFGGSIASGQDEWNCGINLGILTESGSLNSATALEAFDNLGENHLSDIVTALTTFYSTNAIDTPVGAPLQYVKLALINEGGLYVKEPYEQAPLNISGSTRGGYVPQVTAAVTLSSDKYKDPGKYNRFYLPYLTPDDLEAWRIPSSSALAVQAAGLMNDLAFQMDVGSQPVLVLPCAVTQSNTPGDSYLPITSVRVGNVYDTQRRRRNKINEVYSDVSLTDFPDE